MGKTTGSVFALALLVFTLVQAVPMTNPDLQSKFFALQEQLNTLQSLLNKRSPGFEDNAQESNPAEYFQRNARYMSFQPMKKRMVNWQPMKRNVDYTKEQVIRAIEEQLSEILRAGETLGVNADDILNHLRQRNAAAVSAAQ